jgi:ATP-binding cassette subfamily B protein
LERLVQERTVLVIAHRRNTIINAQQIAVLEDGQLIEAGSRAILESHNGFYIHLMDVYRKV